MKSKISKMINNKLEETAKAAPKNKSSAEPKQATPEEIVDFLMGRAKLGQVKMRCGYEETNIHYNKFVIGNMIVKHNYYLDYGSRIAEKLKIIYNSATIYDEIISNKLSNKMDEVLVIIENQSKNDLLDFISK